MTKERLVLVGNGMAGVRTLEELLELAPEQYQITVFGTEPHGNYNRILLSPVLAGEKGIADIMLNDDAWYAKHGITLHKAKTVTQINRARREVVADDGTVVGYDRLNLATGSNPVVIPVPGHQLPGVLSYRDIADVDTMLAAAKTYRHAVVIGGGLLGLEAAYGLIKQGMEVTVVHLLDTLMERQLDPPAAAMLKRSLEDRGINFLLGKQTEAILGETRVRAIRFKDGLEVAADLVVMAVGIRPNIALAKQARLHCERGVVVNDTLQTYDPRIYAVGECVQHRSQTYGLVAPLFEQAKVCANHLAYLGIARYSGSVVATKLKVTGIDVFSAGDYLGAAGTEQILLQDPASGMYKKLVMQEDKLVGAVLYGDTKDSAWYFQLMRERRNLADLRARLLFGEAHLGDAGHGGENRAASMADSAQVCDCNGVCKGAIVKAITTKGLFTLDEVRAHTKASASCGSCTGLVEQILALTQGGNYSTPEKKTLCKCTALSHDEVRAAIREQHLTSLAQIYTTLSWKRPDGCQVCRPALNYYLISTWPHEARDDYQARFINERAHANIQKDGTYSVIPRMLGGETSAHELRALAEVAEKYQVRTVKVTGGQRIDLLGLRKEQLPLIWGDLTAAGFVSGHAYGKSIRTVKTCVGSEWCRFGVQDSTKMGIALEKMTWGSWTPHKFKLAVSGCPRNCAEATIKDFGAVAIESGWELHIGGNGGVKVRATDVLTRVQTEAEVMEYCGAFLQLYREEARYLERTAPWLERVGLSYVKQHLVEDAELRRTLHLRFLDSQKIYQVDPWAERARGVDAHEFQPLAEVSV